MNPPLNSKNRKEWFEYLKKHLDTAKPIHKRKVIDWAGKVIKEYAGDTDQNQDTGERYTQMAQVIMSVEETVQPHLYFKNPTMYAKSKQNKSPWEKRESFVSDLVNYEYRDVKDSGHGIELENELSLLDARLLPFGYSETCWEAQGEMVEDKQDESLMDKAKSFLTGEESQTIDRIPLITKERHVTERGDPLKLILDYRVDHITKQHLIIKIVDVSKYDLKKPKYEQDKVSKLQPSVSLAPDYEKKSYDEKKYLQGDDDFKGYRIYEIEDIDNRVIHTMAEGFDDFIEFGTEHFLPEGSKYSFLWFIEKPNSVYPEPPIKFYRQRASEFSYIYSQVAQQIDKFLPKIGFDVSKLDAIDKERFKTGGLGTFVGFNGSPDAAWSTISPQIQGDLFKYMAMTKELLNMEGGMNDYETSIPQERKAKEAEIIEQGTKARRFKPQKRVKGFVLSQSHKIYQVVLKNAPIEHFIKVLGEEDAVDWWNDPRTGKQTWSDPELAGDYWFDYNVEEVAPMDISQRNANNEKAMTTLLNPQLAMQLKAENKALKIAPAFSKYVKDNLGIRDESEVIADLNILSPEQEHDLWMQGQFPPVNPDENMDEHIQKHSAWVNSPGFHYLPPQIKNGAMAHLGMYQQYLAQKQQPPKNKQQAQPSQPQPVAV